MRIRRNDSIARLVKTTYEAANPRVFYEHHIRIDNRQLQKPDLIIVNEYTAFILDVSVVIEKMRNQGNNVDFTKTGFTNQKSMIPWKRHKRVRPKPNVT